MRREFPDAPHLFAPLSELVLAAITAWLWKTTPGVDATGGEDAQTGGCAVVGR